jgi:hypothetical protein
VDIDHDVVSKKRNEIAAARGKKVCTRSMTSTLTFGNELLSANLFWKLKIHQNVVIGSCLVTQLDSHLTAV